LIIMTYKLSCGCEYGLKFNSGNPAWFIDEYCQRHQGAVFSHIPAEISETDVGYYFRIQAQVFDNCREALEAERAAHQATKIEALALYEATRERAAQAEKERDERREDWLDELRRGAADARECDALRAQVERLRGVLTAIVKVVEDKLDPTDGGLGCISERDELAFWEAFGAARTALSETAPVADATGARDVPVRGADGVVDENPCPYAPHCVLGAGHKGTCSSRHVGAASKVSSKGGARDG
jgi:hypothetical protein